MKLKFIWQTFTAQEASILQDIDLYLVLAAHLMEHHWSFYYLYPGSQDGVIYLPLLYCLPPHHSYHSISISSSSNIIFITVRAE